MRRCCPAGAQPSNSGHKRRRLLPLLFPRRQRKPLPDPCAHVLPRGCAVSTLLLLVVVVWPGLLPSLADAKHLGLDHKKPS